MRGNMLARCVQYSDLEDAFGSVFKLIYALGYTLVMYAATCV